MRISSLIFVSLLVACGGTSKKPNMSVDGGTDGPMSTGGALVCVDTCTDGKLDADESDVDCGGSNCDSCAQGKKCNTAADCDGTDGTTCAGGKCNNPCEDGVRDNDETDVDCGGATCDGCAQGKNCGATSDCSGSSLVMCTADKCDDPCADGKLDGDETDVDCGGMTCDTCAQGKTCKVDSDCDAQCANGKCDDPCADGKLDGTETDVDCGGADCNGCGQGKTCKVDNDCDGSDITTCTNGKCNDPCADGKLDGTETDVDCGGADCNSCAAGKKCLTANDCGGETSETCVAK